MNKKGKSVIVFAIFFLLIISIVSIFIFAGDEPESVLWKQTPTEQVWKNPDGTMTAILGSFDVIEDNSNYILWNENFSKIVSSDRTNYDKMLDNTYSNFKVYFKNNTNTAGAVRFEKNNYSFTYDLSGGKMQWAVQPGKPSVTDTLGSGAPSNSQNSQIAIDINKANYFDAYFNTDVNYEIKSNMLKETFVLKSPPPTFKNYDYLEYTGNIEFNRTLDICANEVCYVPSGTQDDFETSGKIEFKNETGDTIFFLKEPEIWDSAGNHITGIYKVKGSNAQMSFALRINKTWLQNAVYPVFIDPTITVQTANTENLKDAYVLSDLPNSNRGTDSNLIGSEYPTYINYVSFDISELTMSIYSAEVNFSLYAYSRDLGEGNSDNISVHHVYNDWQSTNGTKMNLSETQITWNNQPCGTSFSNSTHCNLTQNNVSISSTGWFNWNISNALINDLNLNKKNISLAFTMISNTTGTIDFASKEYATASYRPKLTITYTPYINILSPTPSQTFTENAGTTRFNISTVVDMDECYYELDGINRTMDSKNATSFNITNITMVDGSHFVRIWCNETTGTWRQSDNVSFNVDSANITKCRDLTVSRTYNLLNDISTAESVCFEIGSNNTKFDGLGNTITGTDVENPQIGILNQYSNVNITNITLVNFSSVGLQLQSNPNNVSISNVNINGDSFYIVFGLQLSGTNISVNKTNIIGSFDDSIILMGVKGEIFDSALTCSEDTGDGCIYAPVGYTNNFNLTNVTYGTETILSGILTRKWYFDYKVNASSGNLQDALVEIYDKDGLLIYSPTTNSTGQITKIQLIEYINNGGVKTYSSPYTVNVSKVGYLSNSTVYNLTLLNNINKFVTLLLSNSAPISTLNSPANDSWSQTALNSFNCSQTDLNGLSNVTLTLWKSPTTYTNTSTITGFSNSTILNRSLSDGTWLWNCLVFDNNSASDWADTNRTINVDTTNPLISYGTNNELNNTNFSRNWIYVNTSITETNFNNITFYLYNSSKMLLTSYTYTSLISYQNFTSLADGTYYYNATIRDKSGRTNSTGMMNITIDDTSPVVNIAYPVSLGSYSNVTSINYTVSDNFGLSTCRYSNGITNTTITCGNNITLALPNGIYTYTIYSNDSLNNWGNDIVTFTISSDAPAITLNYPTLNQYLNTKTNVYFNFTAIDSDGLSFCQLWTNTTGTWHLNTTLVSPVSGTTNFTNLNLIDGFYKYNVWCNDTLGNEDFSSSNLSFTVDTVNPSVIDNSYYPATIYNETAITIYGNASDAHLDKIWIEINSTLVYQNITISSHTGDTYIHAITGAETSNRQNISWKWWANDTAGNQNVSALSYFIVSNRNPFNLTISNTSYTRLDYVIINFTATDLDYDALNYSVYYFNGTFFNSTTENSMNFSGFNTTDKAVNGFYINVSDGYLTNQSVNYTFTIDKTNPALSINLPEASPVMQCSLTNLLNITISDTNLDYCSFNVTYGLLTSTPNTIFDCSNTNFAVAFDNSVQLLSVSSFDEAGNINTSTRYLYFNSAHPSCDTDTPSGGGGAPDDDEPAEDFGFCGDLICQDGTNGTTDRGEDFYSCAIDCAPKLTFENVNLETLLTNCFDASTQDRCIWKTRPGLLTLFVIIILIFVFALFFSIKTTEKGTIKKIVYNNKFKRRR